MLPSACYQHLVPKLTECINVYRIGSFYFWKDISAERDTQVLEQHMPSSGRLFLRKVVHISATTLKYIHDNSKASQ